MDPENTAPRSITWKKHYFTQNISAKSMLINLNHKINFLSWGANINLGFGGSKVYFSDVLLTETEQKLAHSYVKIKKWKRGYDETFDIDLYV